MTLNTLLILLSKQKLQQLRFRGGWSSLSGYAPASEPFLLYCTVISYFALRMKITAVEIIY